MIRLRSIQRRLAGDERGATIVEFAFVAPVFIVMLLGVLDAAHTQYTTSVVNGAMQKAGRGMSLENAGSTKAAIDKDVIAMVKNVAPLANVKMSQLSHYDFSDIGKAEEFTDNNSNGRCDAKEPFEDVNGNGTWDRDRGKEGIGGARDAIVYTATIDYPRMFPMYGLIGMSNKVEIKASTVLRNQPYDKQDRTVTVGKCP